MPQRPQVPPEPPEGLPEGLRDLWNCLHDEATLTSRGALARRLGVSTHTLQRVLVDGALPRFDRCSVRQTRSWTRTLARLARHFGRAPRRWIEAAGIPWTADARMIAEHSGVTRLAPVPVTFAAPSRLAGEADAPPPLLPLIPRLSSDMDP